MMPCRDFHAVRRGNALLHRSRRSQRPVAHRLAVGAAAAVSATASLFLLQSLRDLTALWPTSWLCSVSGGCLTSSWPHRTLRPVSPVSSLPWRGRLARAAGGDIGVDALKESLFESAAEFKRVQEELWEMMDAQEANTSKTGDEAIGTLLEAESFGALEAKLNTTLETQRDKLVSIIGEIAALNPSLEPLKGWQGFGGVDPADCGLNGTWKLLWTNAADATFRRGRRGNATAFQLIDASAGTFTNAVNFDGKSKLRGFRVVVAGEALSACEVQLVFKRVILLRRSRFPWLFGRITIPLPNPKFLRWFGRVLSGGKAAKSNRGAGFTMLYLDQDLRMHQTFDGLYFVQRRLVEEPPLPE